MLHHWFKATDYQVQSRPIVLSVVVAVNVLVGVNLVSEIFFQSTSIPVFLAFFLVSMLQTVVLFRWPAVTWVKATIVPLCFAMLELLFLSNPVSFQSIHFWFALLIIGALIVQGMRAARIWMVVLAATYLVNAWHINRLFGGTYTVEVRYGPYLVIYFTFLLGIFATTWLLYRMLGDAYVRMKQKAEELEQLQAEISKKKATLDRYQHTLLELTRKDAALTAGMAEVNRAVVSAARRALGVSQVSICLFRNNGEELERQVFCTASGIAADGLIITRAQYPRYFEALHSKPFINAHRVAAHPDTAEFAAPGTDGPHIASMLDCPIVLDHEVLGVISCEQLDAERTWESEDELFLQSLADFVALGWQNERVKKLVLQIRQQNLELVDKNHEIGALNEELTLVNDQQVQLNRSLEDAVQKRTFELEVQNRQLTEYAFVNSHLLRAPLARVLGLSQIIVQESTSIGDRELLEALEASARELDEVIRKISELLYAGNNFSREDVNAIIRRRLDRPNTIP